jgi:hypothetical protein
LENVYIPYGHLEYFTEIWDIVLLFGTLCVPLVHFSCFGIMSHEKSCNRALRMKLHLLLERQDFVSAWTG